MATWLMRLIDFWIGVPLCFLFALVRRISDFLSPERKENAPAKIALIKLSEMGAIILSYSLICRIKKEYPNSGIFFLTFKKNQPLLEAMGSIDKNNILTISEDSPWSFLCDTFKAIGRMRKEKIGAALDLELFSRFTAVLTYLSGAGKRIGFYRYHFEGLYRGNLLTHNIQYNPLIHTAKSFLSLAQVIKLTRKDTPELQEKVDESEIVLPRYVSSKEAIEQMRYRLKKLGVDEKGRLFLINPGEGIIPTREWPVENFVSLSKSLLDKDGRNYIIIIGMGGAFQKAQDVCRMVESERCFDLTNKTTFSELLSLFDIAEELIVNDCGLAHIASLTSIKKFVIFGPESPRLYAPLGERTRILYSDWPCSPCLSAFNHRNSACKDNKCLKAIQPKELYELITSSVK